jgi:hypothetical protein
VLVSVLIGLKLAGVVGAIFAIPVAAVLSTFFFYYLQRSTGGARDVTTRAAERVGRRVGRRVRIPTPPTAAGSAAEEDLAAAEASSFEATAERGAPHPADVTTGSADEGHAQEDDHLAAAALLPRQT